jgi:hypothetical protein
MHRVEWSKEDVHRRLSSEARSREFKEAYLLLLERRPALRPYPTLEVLIGMLHAKAASYAEKDGALHALISAIQGEQDLRCHGITLISLALWPALSHSCFKLFPLTNLVPDLFNEVHGQFLAQVLRFDLARTSRIAVTLQRNTEHAVRETVDREARYQDRARAYAFVDADLDRVMEDPNRRRLAQIRDWTADIPEKDVRRSLRRAERTRPKRRIEEPDREILDDALRDMVRRGLLSEEEGRLIAEHRLQGVELQVIARRMGLRSGALRARYFRIGARLRSHLDSVQGSVTRPQNEAIYSRRP